MVQNQTGSGINILDNNGATTTSIRTGTGATVEVLPNATVTFLYDATASRWMMVGGSGSGGLSAWQASTNYNSGAVVTNGTLAYTALETFTSSSSFSTDLFNGYWQQLNLPSLGRNYAQTGNNFEDDTVGGWQLFTLQTQYTFTVSALSAAVPVGATFSNNTQIFTATVAAASGATTLVASGTGAPTGGSTSLTSTTWTFTVSALASAVPVGAVYSNNGHNYTVLQAAAAGATTLVTTTQTIGATQTGTTLTWVSGAIPGMLAAPGNITFSAETNDTTVPSTITVSSNVSAVYSAGAVPSTFPTLGSASSMSLAASNPGISGQYSLLVGNTLGYNLTVGQGVVSPIFSVDQVDQAKMLQNVLSYMATGSDASYLNFSGTSSNTWALYIQDVTNGAWIQPAGVYNFVQGTTTLAGKSTSTWQTPSNLVFFRVALLCLNTTGATSPGAGVLATYFDDLYVGPQTAPTGPAMADSISFTTPLTGTTGGAATVTGYYSRRGEKAYFVGNVAVTSTLSGTAGYTFTLPNSLNIDSTKLSVGNSIAALGYAVTPNGAGTPIQVVYNSGNGATSVEFLVNGAPMTTGVGAGGSWTFFFESPIVGWSSNSSMSSDTDTRVVAMQTNSAPTATITSTPSVLKFSATSNDTHGGYSTSTGLYTVPVTGFYRVTAQAAMTTSLNGNQSASVYIYKNGAEVTQGLYAAAASFTGFTIATNAATTIFCNAGDTLAPYVSSSGTGNSVFAGSTFNWFNVERVSGPAVVAATESVNARYHGATATITSSSSAVTYSTGDFDTHSKYSGSTYTVPVSGKYQVNASLNMSGTFSINNYALLSIYKNGSAYSSGDTSAFGSETNLSVFVSDIVACSAGDTIVIQTQSTGASVTVASSNVYNYFSIARIGN